MEKIHGPREVLLQFNKIFLCFVWCLGRVRELLSFLEKSRKTFLRLDLQKKNFVKHMGNLPKHLSEKFIGDNLSITGIA